MIDRNKQTKPSPKKLQISSSLLTVLFAGIFLIVFIPLFLIYRDQTANQDTINQQLAILQKATGGQQSPDVQQANLETLLIQTRRGIDSKNSAFPDLDQSPEIIDQFLELAKTNGMEITKTMVSYSTQIIKVGTTNTDFPSITFDVDLSGQIPKFQNFLLDLDQRFPTATIQKVAFKPAAKEGDRDTANIVISILGKELVSANQKMPLITTKTIQTFTDKQDKTTDSFKISRPQWRVDWKAAPTDPKWAAFSFFVYKKDNTGRYLETVSATTNSFNGTKDILKGNGEFYIKVLTANISGWEIKILE